MRPDFTVEQAANTELRDYEVMTQAYVEREQDRQLNAKFIASYTAWQSAQMEATNKQGKPVIKKFSQLYDYDKERRAYQKHDKKPTQGKSEDYSILEKLAEINGKGGDDGRL